MKKLCCAKLKPARVSWCCITCTSIAVLALVMFVGPDVLRYAKAKYAEYRLLHQGGGFGSWENRWWAAYDLLYETGDFGEKLATQHLDDRNATVRQAVVFALLREMAGAPLRTKIAKMAEEDPSIKVRSEAALILYMAGYIRTALPLLEAALELSPGTRHYRVKGVLAAKPGFRIKDAAASLIQDIREAKPDYYRAVEYMVYCVGDDIDNLPLLRTWHNNPPPAKNQVDSVALADELSSWLENNADQFQTFDDIVARLPPQNIMRLVEDRRMPEPEGDSY